MHIVIASEVENEVDKEDEIVTKEDIGALQHQMITIFDRGFNDVALNQNH